MKTRTIIVAMFLLSCAGVSEQQKQAAESQLQINLQRCDPILQGYQNGENSYLEVAYCHNQARNEYFEAVNFPYPEVIPFADSYYLALAERVQAGEITLEQAVRINSQLIRELIAQASRERRAAAEQQLAWRELIRSLNTSYYLNRPITCVQTGNIITCN